MNIVLGGTHGLGWEIAKTLRKNDEDTMVLGRSYDANQHGEGLAIDLSDAENVKTSLEKLQQTLGSTTIHQFYWAAGYGYNGDFASQEYPQKMAEVNFANVMPIAQFVWGSMLKSAQTSNFVVISSTTGIKPRADEAVYAATKHAQVGFGRSLGMETERLKAGIKVALILPGGMQTPFWEGVEPPSFNTFNDPKKVAEKIVSDVGEQTDPFLEVMIDRGSV